MAANANADAENAAARMIGSKPAPPAAAANPNMPPKDVAQGAAQGQGQGKDRFPKGPKDGAQGNQGKNDQQRKDGQPAGNPGNNPPKNDQQRKDGAPFQNKDRPNPAAQVLGNQDKDKPKPPAPPARPLELETAPVPDFGDNVEKEMDGRISTYFENLAGKTRRYKDEIKNLRTQVKNMKTLMEKLALGYKVSVEAVVQVSTLIRHYQELIDGIQIMFEDLDKTPLIQPSDFNEIKKLTDMNMVRIQKQFREQVKQIAELYTRTGNRDAANDIQAFDREIGNLSISAQQFISPGQPYGVAPVQGGPVPMRGGSAAGAGAGAVSSRQHVYVRGPQGMLRIASSFKRRFQLFASKLKRQNQRKKVSASSA